METVSLRPVTRENWLAALELDVELEQRRFVANYTPVAAIALAKAYIRPGGSVWEPYAIYAGATMVGFFALALPPECPEECWIFHFFVDQRYQGQGYGAAALARLLQLARGEHSRTTRALLVVHPENHRAQRLYLRAGFRATGESRWDEPVYERILRD